MKRWGYNILLHKKVKQNKTNNEYNSIFTCCMYIILYMYIEPYTCLNMHKYIKVTYTLIL